MKTAVSIPDEVFQAAERLARSSGRSRSEVYSTALREYVGRHAAEEVTESLNRVMEDLGPEPSRDGFVAHSARRTLDASEW